MQDALLQQCAQIWKHGEQSTPHWSYSLQPSRHSVYVNVPFLRGYSAQHLYLFDVPRF